VLREVDREDKAEEWAVVNGSDPLNLVGVLTPGARLPALASNRVLYRGGVPLAQLRSQEITFATELDAAQNWLARSVLLGRAKAAVP